MLRIPIKELTAVAEALGKAAASAQSCEGLHVIWEIKDPRKLEEAALVALKALAMATEMRGPVTPSDEYYLIMRPEQPTLQWPPSKEELERGHNTQ